MRDTVARSFRRWAIAGVIYSLVIADLAIQWIPWKTPVANALLLTYALAHLLGGVGLWRRARWGWRLTVWANIIGFLSMIGVVTALVASWAYLRAIFGDFGQGASIGALLFASVALQLLGLYPSLGLAALLRGEVREDLGGAGRLWPLLFGALLIPLAVGLYVDARYSLTPRIALPQTAKAATIAHLRAALRGEARPTLEPARGYPVGDEPLYVTFYGEGKLLARVTGEGVDLAEATAKAADALTQHPKLHGRKVEGGTIKVDRVVAKGPVFDGVPFSLALSLNPGLDGLRAERGGASKTLLPDDLIRAQRFGVAPLVPGIRELRLGVDVEALRERMDLKGSATLTRLRTEGWVEHEGRALDVVRGNTPPPKTGPTAWREAAIRGGDFILRQIRKDGRFHYQYFPYKGEHTKGGGYSLPRHAGTVYALALLYGETGEARFKEGAERAITYLDAQIPEKCGAHEMACVRRGHKATLGSAALTVVGMLEYQRRTLDERYASTIRRLLAFIHFMQKENGDFSHVYDTRKAEPSRKARMMFYSEEAALALVMAHKVLGDEAALKAAERALDFLTGEKYTSFLGQFIYGADHWTCIAVEEAWPTLKSRQYLDFCEGYSGVIRRLQYAPGDWENADFVGHYGFGAVMVPQAPAAAGFSEAIVSTMALAQHHGEDPGPLEAQVRLALDALARDQVRPDNRWMMPKGEAPIGGIRRSLVEGEIRIDFTQHAVAALIRGAVLFEP